MKAIYVGLQRLMVFTMVVFIAASSFGGFYTKWQFRDDDIAISLKAYLDDTAIRPYVYRRLIPDIANGIDKLSPSVIRNYAEKLLNKPDGSLRFHFAPSAQDPTYALRYEVVYFIDFLSAIALLVASYVLARDNGVAKLPAGVGSAIFLILVPNLQSWGGYFYDYTEVLFFCLFLIFAFRGNWAGLLLVSLFAAWNKESFFFFIPTAFPLLRQKFSLRVTMVLLIACVIVAGAVYEVQRVRFVDNLGGTTENHFWDQVAYFTSPKWLFRMEISYGVPLPHPLSIVWLASFTGALTLGWHYVRSSYRQQITIAAIINLPLFVLFCAAGEVRNLSMLFPGLIIVLSCAAQKYFDVELQPNSQREQ